jgi:formamidopyrimidine-DNA glycosylase
MPELPEVETTVRGLNECVKNLRIRDVWTDYGSPYHTGKENIKDKKYFLLFKKALIGSKITDASRAGKNVLIHLGNGRTIVIHMKMTGHLLYGTYRKLKVKNQKSKVKKEKWEARDKNGALNDPFNKFIHLVFILSNKKHLAFSDMRKFGKVFLTKGEERRKVEELEHLGPDALQITYAQFEKAFAKRQKGKIKQVLMSQEIIAGIGNIYSDEMLWKAGIHPASLVSKIPKEKMKKVFNAMKDVLKKGIDFGGDSMSDYRNIKGEQGQFQHRHNVYRLTGTSCKKPGCKGKIERMKIGGRSAHFCPIHQKLYR